MKHLFFILPVISLLCCSESQSEKDQISFIRTDFADSTKLVGEVISLDSNLVSNALYNIIRDSILLVDKIYLDSPFYFGLYNILTGKRILEFARRGRGPNELLSGRFNVSTHNCSQPNSFFVFDGVRKCILEYEIDSLIAQEEFFIPTRIDIPDGVTNLSKLDEDHFVCFNSYFLNDEKFFNNVDEIYKYNKNASKSATPNWKYFTLNVSDGFIMIAPKKYNRIYVPHRYEDKIDIYDRNLEFIKTLKGPDNITPEYRIREENHISFKAGVRYRSYVSCCYTNNSLYLIYAGMNGIPRSTNYYKPVEIFKLDWNGNLIKRYKSDRYLIRISVSMNERYLYGTSINQRGETELLCYEIE